LKKLTGSVSIYMPKTKKTKPEKTRAKPEKNRVKPEKPSQAE
jgi:hypothetical protein